MVSAVVELNQLNDSSLASKSSRPHAAVELVPVHNPCDEKNKEAAQKCNHFSIRGYVSEVRKRDPKHCYPFTLEESTDSLNELPPMVVPNFRWWQCNSCVPEAKNDPLKDSCMAGNGEAQHDVNADVSILLVGQSSKVDNAARLRNTETCTSIDSNDNKNYSPIYADRKGKGKAHLNNEIPISSGCEYGFLKVSESQRFPQQTLGQLKVDSSDDNEVELRSGFNINGTTEVYETHEVDYVTKTCQGEPQTSSQHHPADSPTNIVAAIVKLPDLNECNGERSYEVNIEGNVTGKINNQFFEDDDDYLGAERRKKPKVRLLSELLGLKENQNPAKGKKKIVSSASSKDEYMKQKRVGSHDDGTKKIVGTSRISKSESGSDSDDVSAEKIPKAKSHCKSKDQLEKRNKKIKMDHADSSSLLQQKIKSKSSHEKMSSSEDLPQNLDFFTRISEKNSVLTKRRGKISQAKKVPTSLIPSKSRMPKECQSTQKDGDADQNGTENVRKASENGLYLLSSYLNKENDQLCVPKKDSPNLSSSQGEEVLVSGNSISKDKEKRSIGETCAIFRATAGERIIYPTENKSVKKPEVDGYSPLAQHMPKKRGRVPQANKEPTSLNPSKSRMAKECESIQNNGDANQKASENVRKASENGHYFLSSYRNKENDQLCVPRKDGSCSSSSQAEPMPVGGNSSQKDREIINIGDTSVKMVITSLETLKPTVACAALTGNHFDGMKTICLTENSGTNKTRTPEADGCTSLAQHMAMQKDLTNEVRGRIQDIDINSIPTDDKTNDQGLGDDIPMDIVELMAKNQYERHLDDPKDKHVISEPPELSATYVRPKVTYGFYGQHLQKFPQSHFLSMKKPLSTDPRTPPMFNENLDLYTYYNTNHLGVRGLPGDNMVSARFRPPSQSQERIRPFSASGLTPNYWNENLNAATQCYPSSFLQPVDSYQKHRAVAPAPPPPPRQSNTDHHHVWPSRAASRMPIGITNPQMISQSSDVLKKGRIHQQSSGSFLNFNLTSASSSLEKQQNLYFSSTCNSGNPASSARSIDVNEAIPAMHLLSLMQNAAKLQNTELSLGPPKVVGSTSSRYPFSKPNSRITVQDNSCHPCYPTAVSTACPFPLTYQNDSGNISRNSATFMGHIPLTLQGQRNMESSHFARPSGDHLPPRRPMAPPHNKRKGVASKSKPAYILNPFQTMKESSNLQSGAVGHNDRTVSHAPDKVICRLNKNPSEFNDLNLVAKYMIGPENLKPRKRVRHRGPRPSENSKRRRPQVNQAIPCMTTAKS